MSLDIVPFAGADAAPPSDPREAPGRPGFDLVELILTGLRPQSAAGYRKDFDAFGRFAGDTAEAALWRLLRSGPGPANAAALAWHAEMQGRGLAPATIARRLASLRRAVRRARMVGLTALVLETDAPRAEAFRDTRGPGAAGWAKMLRVAEVEAEHGCLRGARNLALVRLLHDRALRRGEVTGLDYPDHFDPDRPAVAVQGKGRDGREWLTVNPETREALVRWIERRGDWPGPLFNRADRASRGDRSRITGESINRLVANLAKRAGLGRPVRAHGMRHSAITEALDAGYDVRDVRLFSRHEKIDTVLIYDDRRRDVAGDITRALGRARRRRGSAGK
jgi:integrase/recombinase XerC